MKAVVSVSMLLLLAQAACVSVDPEAKDRRRARKQLIEALASAEEGVPVDVAEMAKGTTESRPSEESGFDAITLNPCQIPGNAARSARSEESGLDAIALNRGISGLLVVFPAAELERPLRATDAELDGDLVPAFRQSLKRLEMEAGARPLFDRRLTTPRQGAPRIVVYAETLRVLGEAIGGPVGAVCRDIARLAHGGRAALTAVESGLLESVQGTSGFKPFFRFKSGDLDLGFRKKDFLAGGDLVVGFGRRSDLEIHDEGMFYVEIEFRR